VRTPLSPGKGLPHLPMCHNGHVNSTNIIIVHYKESKMNQVGYMIILNVPARAPTPRAVCREVGHGHIETLVILWEATTRAEDGR
jgi:hypothetical protein